MTKQAERRSVILDVLSRQPRASVETLTRVTGASAATVRRDLDRLSRSGDVVRIRGGAEPAEDAPQLAGTPFQRNLTLAVSQKRAIAKEAATLIGDGETIIMDAGTTTYFMCPHLAGRQVHVLTNSLPIAGELLACPSVTVHLPGGQVYREQNIILSPFEDDGTAGYAATKMFMGACAVTSRGIEQVDAILVQAERRLLRHADELIVLADSRKLAARAGLLVCDLNAITRLVTDDGATDSAVQALEREGVAVTVVQTAS